MNFLDCQITVFFSSIFDKNNNKQKSTQSKYCVSIGAMDWSNKNIGSLHDTDILRKAIVLNYKYFKTISLEYTVCDAFQKSLTDPSVAYLPQCVLLNTVCTCEHAMPRETACSTFMHFGATWKVLIRHLRRNAVQLSRYCHTTPIFF